jgi:hypothetical protein
MTTNIPSNSSELAGILQKLQTKNEMTPENPNLTNWNKLIDHSVRILLAPLCISSFNILFPKLLEFK